MARQFGWLSTGALPAQFDLRLRGWQRHDRARTPAGVWSGTILVEFGRIAPGDWARLVANSAAPRARALVVGVDDGADRARLLREGFGDVVASQTELAELDARARRLADRAEALPRFRIVGRLSLDLLRRDGLVAGRRLGLHPREFALLWRLADCPGEAVSAIRLLADVWSLSFRPETNSLAVHISRLRAKLRLAGLDGLVETAPGGTYRLVADAPPFAASDPGLALDAYVRNDWDNPRVEQEPIR